MAGLLELEMEGHFRELVTPAEAGVQRFNKTGFRRSPE
jgi:hypothetical protein